MNARTIDASTRSDAQTTEATATLGDAGTATHTVPPFEPGVVRYRPYSATAGRSRRALRPFRHVVVGHGERRDLEERVRVGLSGETGIHHARHAVAADSGGEVGHLENDQEKREHDDEAL